MLDSSGQLDEYPYTSLGYSKCAMTKAFLGYGEDVRLDNGFCVTAQSQQDLSLNLLKTMQKFVGGLTLNEITTYCLVVSRTIIGELISVKDIAAELELPVSTTSHTVARLRKRRFLEQYPCSKDGRRKWLRVHPGMIASRIGEGNDMWRSQRNLLKTLLIRDNEDGIF